MRNYLKYIFISILLFGCSDSELESFDSTEGLKKSIVSPKGLFGDIVVNNSDVVVPIRVMLDVPATRAFEVEIELNNTTIDEQIASGTLVNVVAIPYSEILTPNVVTIAYGAKEAVFSVKITRTILERIYGKNAVFGYKLKNPGKGNSVQNSEIAIVEINIDQILSKEDLHYVSIFNGEGRVISAANRRNYTSTAAGLAIPLTASLASFPGRTFSVEVVPNTLYPQTLIANGDLPSNTIILPSAEYSYIKKLTFPSNTSEVDFELNVAWNMISKYIGKKIAICLELTEPTLHILDPDKKMIVALIDPASVLETDITNQGVLTVSREHTGGANHAEGSSRLIDNNVNTKFYQGNFVGDLWCQLAFPTPQKVGTYTISSANNLPNRDPQHWYLAGSNDGTTWTVLDTQGPIVFSDRYMVKRFDIAVPREFRFYRWYVTANVGDSGFQVAEWRLISIP